MYSNGPVYSCTSMSSLWIFRCKTGRFSFTSHPTISTFVAVIQNYTGYVSSRVSGIDVILYTLDGIGTSVKPVRGIGVGSDGMHLYRVLPPVTPALEARNRIPQFFCHDRSSIFCPIYSVLGMLQLVTRLLRII
jgi:hypothetical protein